MSTVNRGLRSIESWQFRGDDIKIFGQVSYYVVNAAKVSEKAWPNAPAMEKYDKLFVGVTGKVVVQIQTIYAGLVAGWVV